MCSCSGPSATGCIGYIREIHQYLAVPGIESGALSSSRRRSVPIELAGGKAAEEQIDGMNSDDGLVDEAARSCLVIGKQPTSTPHGGYSIPIWSTPAHLKGLLLNQRPLRICLQD